MSTLDLHLFARPTAGPFSIQIIGDPAAGPAGPFALVQRYADQLNRPQRQTTDVNGWKVGVNVFDNGNGAAVWNLPDGGQGYVRSRGLDRDTLVGIVASLTTRDSGAAIPGFDYLPDPTASPALQLLAEHLNTDVQGSVAVFECQVVATSYIYRIAALDGDPVFQYAGVIDRPVPLEVGVQEGIVVVIQGTNDPTAPTIHDIVNADPDAWRRLLANPVV